MYARDSFFTLGPWEQVGLLGVSAGLSVVTLWLAWLLMRRPKLPVRVVIALVILWDFVWVSPQIYYLYYQTIIPGLPWQVVLDRPPSVPDLLVILGFAGEPTLSEHGKGVLGWALIGLAVWPSLAALRRPKSRH